MRRAYLWLILSTISWGISNPFSDVALEELPVSEMFMIEIGSGALLLSVFFKRSWRHLPWKWVLILGLLQPGLTYLFGNIGYASGTVVTGLIIMSAEVLLLALFGAMFLKEQLKQRDAFALTGGFLGAVLAGYSAQAAGIGNLWSNLAFALAATAAAGYAVVIRKIAVEIEQLDFVGLAWGQALVSLALATAAFPFNAAIAGPGGAPTLTNYLAAIGAGIFGVALPFILYAKAATLVKTAHAAVALNLIPIVGIGFGAMIGRGLPTNLQLIGGALVISSVLLLERREVSH